jgi:HlyD family secretion protein
MTSRAKRFLWIGLGALVLVALVLVNVRRTPGGQASVEAGVVKRGSISATVRAPGRVEPETQVKLSAKVPGSVVRLAVKEGDRVRKGQFLLQIDDAQYRAQVREAAAAIAAARSNLRLAEAALAQSEAQLKRKEALSAQNLVSPEELDLAKTQRNSDRARVDANQEEIHRAEATLQVAQDNLRKTRFDSPIDGTVTQLSIERGEIVVIGTMNNPGTVVMTVADLSRMKVVADVDETDVGSIQIGQPAQIKVDALPDTTLTGKVSKIANSPYIQNSESQEQQTNFKVDVMIENPPAMLRPGMTSDVEIKTATRDNVLHVPIQAVVVRTAEDLERPGKGSKRKRDVEARESENEGTGPGAARKRAEEIRGVFVIAKGLVEFRKVRPGIASDTDYEISGELKPGEKVVIGPHKVLRTLHPGQRVKIEEPKKRKETR